MTPDELRAALVLTLCTDHGHASREGGLNCRTCHRRADALLPVVRAYAAAELHAAAEDMAADTYADAARWLTRRADRMEGGRG